MSNSLKAILFDIDGVLIDSERVYHVCWREAARQNGYQLSPEQAWQLRSLDSRLAGQLVEKWYGTPLAYPAIRATRKKLMQEYLAAHPLALKPGVKEVLEYLQKNQFLLAVVTAADIDKATAYLHSVGIDSYFSKIICAKMVERGKPFPDVYEWACQQLQVSPQNCLAVEDSPNGVKSAHQAGCRTIMIPDLTPYTADLAEFVDAH